MYTGRKSMTMRILLAEQDENLAAWLQCELQKMGFLVERVSSGDCAEKLLV